MMNVTQARRLAWFLAILSISLTGAGVTLLIMTVDTPVPQGWGFRGFASIFSISLGVIGEMIASRRPENMIGWIFLAAASLAGIQVFAENYPVYVVLAHPGTWHGGVFAAWLANWIWIPGVGLVITLLLLLFPDGRLPSPRWRWAVYAAVIGIAAGAVGVAFTPGVLPDFPAVRNPYSISNASAAQAVANIGFLAVLAAMVAAVIAQSLQFRRAEGLKRQQMKWFAVAASFAAASLVVNVVLSVVLGGSVTTNLGHNTFASKVSSVVAIVALALIPVATGTAILRYRLYDLDIVIRRTLVYGPLTAALAGVFAATISVTQKLFVAATGKRSDAAVVITTLVIVSLVTPARTFIQTVVDRRFKNFHDPRREIEAFTSHAASVAEVLNRENFLRNFLERSVDAFEAEGGAVEVLEAGYSRVVSVAAPWDGTAAMAAHLASSAISIGVIKLGRRRDGMEYSAQDRDTLQRAAETVAKVYAAVPGK